MDFGELQRASLVLFASLSMCVCKSERVRVHLMWESAGSIEKTTNQKITLRSQLFLNLIIEIYQHAYFWLQPPTVLQIFLWKE